MYVIESEVKVINVAGASASVSELDLCSLTLALAIGSECGTVRLYTLVGHMRETSLNIVTDTDKQVHNLHQGDGPQCTAVFSLLNSPVRALQFADLGTRLAIGFQCGRVVMLDINKSSVLFVTDNISNPNYPISSLSVKSFTEVNHSINSEPEVSESKSLDSSQRLAVFVMTRDAHLVVLDGSSGHILISQSNHGKELTAVSMYIIEGGSLISDMLGEKHSLRSPQDSEAGDEPSQTNAYCDDNPLEGEPEALVATKYFGETSLLICLVCEDLLQLYSLKSVVQV
ncbi:uncharacterized protein LOC110807390 [Carica papaya]|uniref:uncharacterized protein LOC110807390 n=1 Tax=Carica papaya TaxID=3649 RepID=UPI000B8CC4B9|nr:uncharacterized protein LOC110807390 [Carica papaya]